MNKKIYKLELPKSIGESITFKVENSPYRHGKIIDFLTHSEENIISVIGYKVKCKNSTRSVLFDEIIEDQII